MDGSRFPFHTLSARKMPNRVRRRKMQVAHGRQGNQKHRPHGLKSKKHKVLNQLPPPEQLAVLGVGSPHGDDRLGWTAIQSLRNRIGAGIVLREIATPGANPGSP